MGTSEATVITDTGRISLHVNKQLTPTKAATVIEAIANYNLSAKLEGWQRLRPNNPADLNKARHEHGSAACEILGPLSQLSQLEEIWLICPDRLILRFKPRLNSTQAIKNIQQTLQTSAPAYTVTT